MRDQTNPQLTYCEDPIPGKMTFRINSVSNGGGVSANNQDVALNNGLFFGIEEAGSSVPVRFSQPKEFELPQATSLMTLPYKAKIKSDGNARIMNGTFEIIGTVIIEY